MSGTGGITESSVTARTDPGVLALWNPARFAAITSYQTWEHALLDDQDIERHVAAGDLAPSTSAATGHSRS